MSILNDLNKEQKEAVEHRDGPLLIVAGAGTGKTTVIASRFAWLIQQGLAKPEEILAITFTDAASVEMQDRINNLLPYGYVDLWINTFHSTCEKILRTHGLDIGLSTNFRLLNTTQSWQLIRQNLNKFDLDYYQPLGNPTKFIHSLIKHFSRAKDEGIYAVDYLEYAKNCKLNTDSEVCDDQEASRINEVAQAYTVYQKIMLENNVLDFGDLINYTIKLFQTRPNILRDYLAKFKYILVDEFQDTNWVQYELIKLLAGERGNVTVVGDDDQSVYKFRGASLSNIFQFKKDFPNSKEVFLIKNYRSKQNILDLAYKFIQQNNPYRLEYQLDNMSKRLMAENSGDGIIEYFNVNSSDDETALVIKKIVELKTQQKDLTWSDFAILVRANDYANQFINGLEIANIPYQFLASRGLYNKPLILDLIAYLRLLDNYHESSAMWRVLNWKVFGINDQDLVKISHFANQKTISLYEASQKIQTISGISTATIDKVSGILDLIIKHTNYAKDKKPSELLLVVLVETGYLKYLDSLVDNLQHANYSYLQQFRKHVQQLEELEGDGFGLKKFIDMMNLEMEAGEYGALEQDVEAGPDMVKIMTIHGAKGLEFKYVFLVNLADLRFPTIERKDPILLPSALIKEILPDDVNWHLSEERRLFYVGITRAKNGIFFTTAKDYGGIRLKKPSRFLYELNFEKEQALAPRSTLNKSAVKMNKELFAQNNIAIKRQVAEQIVGTNLPTYLPKYFSYTQLKSFKTCPYQYRYAHILKIPVFGKATFSFGKTMHLTLQKFFQIIKDMQENNNRQTTLFAEIVDNTQENFRQPTMDSLLKIYNETWIEDWYDSKQQQEEYKEKGRKSLTSFYELHKDNWPKIKHLEIGFTVKIGDYSIKGQIDRVDSKDDGVEIIDYKTGIVPTKPDRDQLFIYQLATEAVLKEKPVLLTYYYLNENQQISFLATSEELSKFQEEIVITIEEIKKSDFKATPSQKKCRSCDFKDICEFRQM